MSHHQEHWPSIEMGQISEESSDLPEDLQHKLTVTYNEYKKAQPILDIADTFLKMPLSSMEHTLKNAMTHAGDGVAQTFFDKRDSKFMIAGKDFTSLRNDMAICIMVKGLGQVPKYDFNKTVNVPAANKKLKSLINSKEGISLGQELLLQDLIAHHHFQKFLNKKQKWVERLEDVLLDEVYIIGTLVKQMGEKDDLPVKMKIFMLKELGSKKVHDVLKKWEDCCDKKTVKPTHDFICHDNLLLGVTSWMNDAFTDKVKAASYEMQNHAWDTGKSRHVKESIYGAGVRSWLGNDHAARRLHLRTSHNPQNIMKQIESGRTHHGCFLANTKVMLEDGDSIPIEHLKENDQVIGNHGLVGTVSSEKIHMKFESETPAYGFNDEEPFFTASRPFWTQRGWRAVDPHGAKEENSWLEVGLLSPGDHVRKIKSYQNGKVKYEWVEVKEIQCKKYPAGTHVYGVHMREGPRSYHANGFLVLENYPEITTHRVVESMADLSLQQQLKMTKHLEELKQTLSKLLGAGPADAMAAIAKRHVEYKLHNGNKSNKTIPLKEVCLSKVNLHYRGGRTKHGEYTMPKSLALVRGHLFVDGRHVSRAHIKKGDKVTWARPVHSGKWEHGTVKLHHGRLSGQGFVSLTKNQADRKSLTSSSFTATVNENTYKCYRSVEPETDETSTISEWEDFGGLIMGTDFSSGECKTIGKIKIPPAMDEYYDFGNSVTFTSDDKYQLHVNVNLTADWRSVIGYCKLTGVFSEDFSSFSGSCVQYDVTAPGFEGKTYAWKGVIEKSPETVAMLKTVKKKNMAKKVHHQKKALRTFDAVDGPTTKSSSTAMAETTSTETDADLTIDDLYMLTPPDMDAVHTLTFSYLQEGMKYKMSDDNRENILGVGKPTPSGELATVCDKYGPFLGTRFANAYCMYGLSQSSHFEDTITEEERNKLLFYFNGADTGCLSADADYNNVNNEFSRVAYLESLPDLEKYLKSSEGGEYWAKKLYDRLTEQQVLNGLALQAESDQTLAIIQKQSMVLFCLAPDQDYGSDFYKQILTTKLNIMSSFFQGDPDSEEVMTEVFQDNIHQLVLLILSQSDETSGEATQQLQTTLAEAMQELQIEATASAEETASAIVTHMEEVISSTVVALNGRTGPSWDTLITSLNNCFGENYHAKAFGYLAGTLMFHAMWTVSIYFTVKMFMQWDSLKPEQKASLVIDTVQMGLDLLNRIPDIIKGFGDCVDNGKGTITFFKLWNEGKNQPEVVQGIEAVMERGVEEDVGGTDFSEAVFNQELADAAAESATELEQEVGLWTKMLNISEGLAQGLGFVGALAGCVVMGFQIARDFKNGASVAQKSLDICQGVTLAVAATASAVGLLVEMACLPVIGIACAILGIAFAIAALFIKKDPPKPKPTKIDTYVKDEGKPALAELPAPSDEWIEDYKQTSDADDGSDE